jgi:hypothetical protein
MPSLFYDAPNVRSAFFDIGVCEADMDLLKNHKYLEDFANELHNKSLSLPFRMLLKMLFCFHNFGYVDHEMREDILMEFFFHPVPSLQHFLDFFNLVDNFWKEKRLCSNIEFVIQEKLKCREKVCYCLVNSLLLFNFPIHLTRAKKQILEPFLNDSGHLEKTKSNIANALARLNKDVFFSIPNEKNCDFEIRKRNFFYEVTNLEY